MSEREPRKVGIFTVIAVSAAAVIVGVGGTILGISVFSSESDPQSNLVEVSVTQTDGLDEPVEEPVEIASWVPSGFTQIDESVAYRLVRPDGSWECQVAGDGVCLRVELATAETCTVKLDMSTLDDSNRIIENLWETADVPAGTIGFVEFYPTDPNFSQFLVYDGDCYY